jgi:phytoene desaturase
MRGCSSNCRGKTPFAVSRSKVRVHTCVIGAGFGGLAAALRARALGHDVTLLDRLPAAGGRAQVFTQGGFRHDAGPTVITAPFLFEELFALFGKRLDDYVELRPLNTWYEFCFQDGRRFTYTGDLDHTLQEIARFEPADVEGYRQLLTLSEAIFNVGFGELAHRPFLDLRSMLAQVPALLKLQSYRTVYGLVSRYIRNEELRKVFSVHPLLVGGNPYTTTSIYTLIHFLERKWGVHFCMGGTGRLVAALQRLASEQGIQVRLGADVEELHCSGNRVTTAETRSGERFAADTFIFNGDPPYAYQHLLPSRSAVPLMTGLPRPERFLKYSMGLFVLYFGTRRTYPDVAHHTIWFGPRHRELLCDIFDRHVVPDDFSLYVHRPTATDPDFAPPGCDSFYVLCPVSNLKSGTDWSVRGPSLRDAIVKALDRSLLPGLQDCLCEDFFMTPQDFKERYRSVHGAGFSIAPVFSQSAGFRFPNRDPRYQNLLFAGAGTHPGAGLPGVLSSAKVVESLLRVAGG